MSDEAGGVGMADAIARIRQSVEQAIAVGKSSDLAFPLHLPLGGSGGEAPNRLPTGVDRPRVARPKGGTRPRGYSPPTRRSSSPCGPSPTCGGVAPTSAPAPTATSCTSTWARSTTSRPRRPRSRRRPGRRPSAGPAALGRRRPRGSGPSLSAEILARIQLFTANRAAVRRPWRNRP